MDSEPSLPCCLRHYIVHVALMVLEGSTVIARVPNYTHSTCCHRLNRRFCFLFLECVVGRYAKRVEYHFETVGSATCVHMLPFATISLPSSRTPEQVCLRGTHSLELLLIKALRAFPSCVFKQRWKRDCSTLFQLCNIRSALPVVATIRQTS